MRVKTTKSGEVVITFRYRQGLGFRVFADRQEYRAWTRRRKVSR
jgi:hypothetical protein